MANKLHIKKDDQVKVLSGRDRGAVGRVLRVIPKEGKAIIEGVNMVSKHKKPSQTNPEGGIVKQEAPVDACKLMLIDPTTKKPTRIGRMKTEDGWVRVSKKSGEIIP